MISRRGLLTTAATTAAAAGLGLSFPPSRASAAVPHAWVGAGDFLHVYDPAQPGGPAEYINDHCLIRANDGTWHLFGITGDMAPPGQGPDSGAEHDFAHATAPSLTGPWTRQEHALHVDPDYYGEEHLWAPHVVEHDGKYHMFYAAGGAEGAAVNLATSTDLKTWTRLPSGPLFRGIVARDPFVVRVGERWVMYYCELAGRGGNHIVAARTSTDLTRWSEPFTVFTDPATEADSGPVTESPYVVRREGWWYLFIGPRGGYEGTDVYASTDPMRFTPDGYAGHLPAHAPEVISDGGREWATNCGWFEHGVHLAPLNWRTAPPIWHTRDNPAVVLGADGRLAAFALDPTGDGMIRRVQTDPGGDAWGDWEPFAPACATTPTFGVDADGQLEVFVLGKDGAGIARRVQKKDGSWGEWTEFAAAACAAPAVARNGDGCLEAFVIGPSRELAHRRQTSPGGEWSGWQRFGTAAGGPPAVCTDADGRLTVLAVGPSREHIARRFQTVPGGGWSEWESAFGPTPCGDAPTVARDVTGRLEVQALVPYGGAVARRRQNAPGGEWGDWEGEFLGWSSMSPTVIANRDGRLESFAVSPGGALTTRRFQTSASGGWSAREDFGGGLCTANPSAARDAAGRIHLFAVAPDGTVSTRVQTAANGEWGDWQPFGTERIAALPAGQAT
ncbi:family 43 glycosylhydrolase [Streptomyces marispadix]|uniref:Family 43 glycosylhydrolase n=1 Tax=Streptomyces marispadix TaxID=2922868 RepID=A0ABS9T0E7_9ACTN|nr:family 43 glycosylhydrolase [Streptomyces marispadix]MCH6162004.1 family 43 glycosylhydrolase [Streptomyces marispadix]